MGTKFLVKLTRMPAPVRAEILADARFPLKVDSQPSVALTVEVLAQIPFSIQVD
jgi:hypothetical protein